MHHVLNYRASTLCMMLLLSVGCGSDDEKKNSKSDKSSSGGSDNSSSGGSDNSSSGGSDNSSSGGSDNSGSGGSDSGPVGGAGGAGAGGEPTPAEKCEWLSPLLALCAQAPTTKQECTMAYESKDQCAAVINAAALCIGDALREVPVSDTEKMCMAVWDCELPTSYKEKCED